MEKMPKSSNLGYSAWLNQPIWYTFVKMRIFTNGENSQKSLKPSSLLKCLLSRVTFDSQLDLPIGILSVTLRPQAWSSMWQATHSSIMIRGKKRENIWCKTYQHMHVYTISCSHIVYVSSVSSNKTAFLLHEFAASKGIRPHPNDSALPRLPAETPWVFDWSVLESLTEKIPFWIFLGENVGNWEVWEGNVIKFVTVVSAISVFHNIKQILEMQRNTWINLECDGPGARHAIGPLAHSAIWLTPFKPRKDRSGILANFVLHCTWLTQPIYGYPQSTLKPVM